MSKIEKIYRMRRGLLVTAFIFSCLIFLVMCLFNLLLPLHRALVWGATNERILFIFEMAALLAFLLMAVLFVRFVLFRAATLRNQELREAVDDERIKLNWLRAYRITFFAMSGVHLVYLFLEAPLFHAGLPHAAWVSSTLGLMTFFGTALYLTREAKRDPI